MDAHWFRRVGARMGKSHDTLATRISKLGELDECYNNQTAKCTHVLHDYNCKDLQHRLRKRCQYLHAPMDTCNGATF